MNRQEKKQEKKGKRVSGTAAPRAAEVVGAAQRAELAALERLVARGGDVNASWRNYRPLHALIQERPHERGKVDARRLACMDWLLAHGADPDSLGAWPSSRTILVAAFAGVPEYVERLRAAGARVDLHVQAALGERKSVVKALEREPGLADLADEGGLRPLHCCMGSQLLADDARLAKRFTEIAALLLDAGADPNARVRSWAHDVDVAYFAIGPGKLERFELLLARGADASAALVSAAWNDDKRFAEAALRHGGDADRPLQDHRPVMNELVRWGRFEHALWLLARGASPNAPDARGWTALHQAASRGNERMFRALLEARGDLERRDEAGQTPLDVARAKKAVKLLAGIARGLVRPTRARKKA